MTKSEMFDMASQELAKLQAEIARLRADLGHIRGFASVMDENNWRDCKLYISRQCDAAHEQRET